MPVDCAASIWSLGRSISAARQISQLKAEPLSMSANTPAATGPSVMPTLGSAKKMSNSKVINGVARSTLT